MLTFAEVLTELLKPVKPVDENSPYPEVYRFARAGWNGKGMYMGLQRPDEWSANSLPYLWIVTAQGGRVPYAPSQTDMLSADWFAVVAQEFGADLS